MWIRRVSLRWKAVRDSQYSQSYHSPLMAWSNILTPVLCHEQLTLSGRVLYVLQQDATHPTGAHRKQHTAQRNAGQALPMSLGRVHFLKFSGKLFGVPSWEVLNSHKVRMAAKINCCYLSLHWWSPKVSKEQALCIKVYKLCIINSCII